MSSALKILVEVREIQLPPNEAPFEYEPSRTVLGEAVETFGQYIEDNDERENAVRRALAWTLNLNDRDLLALTLRIQMPFPNTVISDRRRFLEDLWQSAFSNWQVKDFDPDDYDIEGMPPIESWMAVVFQRAGLKVPSE
ncbi:MAG: hypothetical protein HC836_22240 [Richelia sp. RM2_1_2]|nr:hypothetical protein [Richelia sp. RM2_1_2]